METIQTLLSQTSDLVWGVPMIVLLVGTGLYLTIALRGSVAHSRHHRLRGGFLLDAFHRFLDDGQRPEHAGHEPGRRHAASIAISAENILHGVGDRHDGVVAHHARGPFEIVGVPKRRIQRRRMISGWLAQHFKPCCQSIERLRDLVAEDGDQFRIGVHCRDPHGACRTSDGIPIDDGVDLARELRHLPCRVLEPTRPFRSFAAG